MQTANRPAEPSTRAARPWGHRPALDGLRTIAVYLVVAFHAGSHRFSGGFIGVDLFFVLSGFLVTTILWTDIAEHGTIRFARFYSRRARRLVPAGLVTIAGTALLMLIVSTTFSRADLIDDARASALWFANWHFAAEAGDYFADAVDQSPYQHFWSLSIEEQFYVAFPLLLWMITRIAPAGSRRQATMAVLAALAGLSIALQFASAYDVSRAYYGTDTRAYQLLFGALLSLGFAGLRKSQRPISEAVRKVSPMVAIASLGGIVLLATSIVEVSVAARGLAAAMLSAAVLGALEVNGQVPLGRLLAARPLAYLGRISYGTYLWHWPLIIAMRRVEPDLSSSVVFVLSATSATAIAAGSHALIEQPLRQGRPSLAQLPIVAAALVASVAIALGSSAMLNFDMKPVVGSQVSTAAQVSIPDGPTSVDSQSPGQDDGTTGGPTSATGSATLGEVVGDDVGEPAETAPTMQDPILVPGADRLLEIRGDRVPEPAYCGEHRLGQCARVTPGDPTLVLLGDSSSRLLIPALDALAAERGFAFHANTLPGCPWQQGLFTDNPKWDDACTRAQQATYRTLIETLQPDLVLAYALGRLDPGIVDHDAFTGEKDDRYRDLNERAMMRRSTRDSLALLLEHADRVALIEPSPLPPFDPNDCLSATDDATDCRFRHATPEPMTERAYRTLANETPGVESVDIDRISCPNYPDCELIIDGTVVYRDALHVWQGYFLEHRDELWELIEPLLPNSSNGS